MKLLTLLFLLNVTSSFGQIFSFPTTQKTGLNVFYNPAQLDSHRTNIAMRAGNAYFTQLTELQIGGSYGNKNTKGSFGINSISSSGYHTTSFLLGYAIRLNPTLSIGINLGVENSNLSGTNHYAPLATIGIDKTFKKITLISNVRLNLSKNIEAKDNLYLSSLLALKYQTEKVSLIGELKYSENMLSATTWLNYTLTPKVDFFTGINFHPNKYIIGGRLHLSQFTFIVSFTYHTTLGLSPDIIVDYAY